MAVYRNGMVTHVVLTSTDFTLEPPHIVCGTVYTLLLIEALNLYAEGVHNNVT